MNVVMRKCGGQMECQNPTCNFLRSARESNKHYVSNTPRSNEVNSVKISELTPFKCNACGGQMTLINVCSFKMLMIFSGGSLKSSMCVTSGEHTHPLSDTESSNKRHLRQETLKSAKQHVQKGDQNVARAMHSLSREAVFEALKNMNEAR